MNVVELERNGTPTPTLTPSTTADGIKKKRARRSLQSPNPEPTLSVHINET